MSRAVAAADLTGAGSPRAGRNVWPGNARLPRPAAAVMSALHIGEPSLDPLAELQKKEWEQALLFADRGGLTLMFREAAARAMPDWVRERIARNARDNAERLARIVSVYQEVSGALAHGGIDFLVLKGFTLPPLFGADPASRVQYDLDLFCPGEGAFAAREALAPLGFEPLRDFESFPTDHLPTLIRRTGWQWRGDYFDPDIPVSVELHFRFWDPETERLAVPGLEQFWERRTRLPFTGLPVPVLHPVDATAYAALHLLRHLLRGSLRPSHVCELACLLHHRAGDTAFWSTWESCHTPESRRLQAVSFLLAASWFGGLLPAVVSEEIGRLPAGVHAWFELWADSPAAGLFAPNKDELWLHLELCSALSDRCAIARRKLLPARPPGPVDGIYLKADQITLRRRVARHARYAAFLLSRAAHHARAAPRVVHTGARWTLRRHSLGREFWTFLGAASLYNLALFVFVLLYNLRLLELGFREELLGAVGAASTAGSFAGTLPAAVLVSRLGIRNTLIGCFGATSAVMVGRSLATTPQPLVALAFAGGLLFAVWAVSLAPAVAQAVPAEKRPAAFSLLFSVSIAIGIAGNALGGQLASWFHANRPVLLLTAGLVAAAVWPAARLRMPPFQRGKTAWPGRNRILGRFLLAFAVWHLATGSFNPFANAYLARLGYSAAGIGAAFSFGQFTQVVAILLAPAVLRRFGVVSGVGLMMAATALSLLGLALQAPGLAAALLYAVYMAFQWMSEPGINTLVMGSVRAEEQSAASALMCLVAFSAQSLAALSSGMLIGRHGYGTGLALASAAAVFAAWLFRRLPAPGTPPPPASR